MLKRCALGFTCHLVFLTEGSLLCQSHLWGYFALKQDKAINNRALKGNPPSILDLFSAASSQRCEVVLGPHHG